MSKLATTLVATAAAFCAHAQASTVTFATASSTAGPQADAEGYRAVVSAAMATPSAKSMVVAQFDNLSNQHVFGGSALDLVFQATIDFGVSPAQAGSWGLRAGVDFGHGGAVFLDGVALGFKATDMWWGGSYANPSQSFQFSSVAIGAGNHRLQLFGLEHCCDGGQQAQFSLNGSPYTTFGSHDGLTTAVPEPETYALMLAGLGVIGIGVRRRARR